MLLQSLRTNTKHDTTRTTRTTNTRRNNKTRIMPRKPTIGNIISIREAYDDLEFIQKYEITIITTTKPEIKLGIAKIIQEK